MKNLKSSAIKGVRLTGLSTAAIALMQFMRTVILARLLLPEDFGLMAMVMLVVGFAQILSQMGFQEAIIQHKDPTRNELSTLYWFNIAMGAIIFVIVWAFTPLFALGFKASELETAQLKMMIPVVSITFLMLPFGSQFRAMAQKTLNFRLIAFAEIFSEIAFFAVSVTFAWAFKLGVWSLVWGQLAGAGTRTAILIAYGFRQSNSPRLHFARADLKSYLGFGLYRVGATSVNYWNSRVDQLLIGMVLGPQALGYYSIAVSITVRPIQRLNPIITSVAFPVFSMIQDDAPRLKRGFLQMIRSISFINSPVIIGIAAVAPLAVPLLLGEKWAPATQLIQVLALYSLVNSVANPGGSLILSQGRADWAFYWNAALLLFVTPAIYAASLSGEVMNVCWTMFVMQTVLLLIYYHLFIRRLIGPCLTGYAAAAGVPILIAGVMGLAAVSAAFLPGIPSLKLLLAIQTITGVLTYAILVWLFQRDDLFNAINLLFNKGK